MKSLLVGLANSRLSLYEHSLALLCKSLHKASILPPGPRIEACDTRHLTSCELGVSGYETKVNDF